MSVALLGKDYNTGYCEFCFDDWDKDKNSLPTINTPGKEKLATMKGCSQGSIAISTDLSLVKCLNGNNEWV